MLDNWANGSGVKYGVSAACQKLRGSGRPEFGGRPGAQDWGWHWCVVRLWPAGGARPT